MDAQMLDGNSVAGLLQEAFGTEMTTAVETCAACGAADAIGAVRVFQAAGIVMRCPHCDSVLMTIVKNDTQVCIGFAGMRTLQVAL